MYTPSNFSRRQFLRLASLGSAALAGGSTLRSFAQANNSKTDKVLGVALLGLGGYSRGELGPSLLETKNCKLTGVITGHPEKGVAWAKQYNLKEKNVYSYDSMDAVVNNPDIDIIYVVTPPGNHRDFVIRAAKAGKHVISEKPLATNVEDCEAMIKACKDNNVQFSVGYRLFFDPYHSEMRRLARDGDFGVFKKMKGQRGFKMGQHAWRIEKKLAGGGPMYDIGIYLIQGACMAQNGETPVEVAAKEMTKLRPDFFTEVEETMQFSLKFANGSRFDGLASYNGTGDNFRAEGDKGWIEFRQHAFTYKGVDAYTSRGRLNYPMGVHQQALQMDDFADCVRTGRKTIVPGEMGLRDIKILAAIYEAAKTGTWVKV